MNVNDLRKRAPLSVAVAAALGMSGPAMAQMQTDNPGGATGDVSVPAPTGGSIVLFDQTDNASGNGAPDQDFEAAYDIYDAEAADDFVVPSGVSWIIEEVNTVGTSGGAANSVDITFYTDAGGLPGSAIPACTFTGVVPVETSGDFTITLPTPCELSPGTYWMAQQTNQDLATDGQHFWSNRTVANGNEGVWRNPNDGFGTGCTDFTPQTTCGVGGGVNPDFLFSLAGQEGSVLPSVPAIPTLNRWGLSALVIALLGVSGWVLMRRRDDAV